MINLLLSLISLVATSFHTLSFTSIEGSTLPMSAYQGKKILLVNIATNSPLVSQLTALQQLHQQYKDSLIVIAFPSNSFGHESRSNAEIKTFCQSNYQTSFLLASKVAVTGSTMDAVYQWLAYKNNNGDGDILIGGDFQKVLIARNGTLEAVFSNKISPMDPKIIQAVTAP